MLRFLIFSFLRIITKLKIRKIEKMEIATSQSTLNVLHLTLFDLNLTPFWAKILIWKPKMGSNWGEKGSSKWQKGSIRIIKGRMRSTYDNLRLKNFFLFQIFSELLVQRSKSQNSFSLKFKFSLEEMPLSELSLQKNFKDFTIRILDGTMSNDSLLMK